jgi:hypothetical protein
MTSLLVLSTARVVDAAADDHRRQQGTLQAGAGQLCRGSGVGLGYCNLEGVGVIEFWRRGSNGSGASHRGRGVASIDLLATTDLKSLSHPCPRLCPALLDCRYVRHPR